MERKAAAIIVAAGSSRRMGGIDKISAELLGKPLIAHTIEAFERAGNIDAIVIVAREERIGEIEGLAAAGRYVKVVSVCGGGRRRQDSTYNGLLRTVGYDIVAVHDGARPCVRSNVIEQCVDEAKKYGAVVAASPLFDTIKRIDSSRTVVETIDRSVLVAACTPQVFERRLLLNAYSFSGADATDEAMLVERAGGKVRVYVDCSDNVKVTVEEDLVRAERVLMMARRA